MFSNSSHSQMIGDVALVYKAKFSLNMISIRPLRARIKSSGGGPGGLHHRTPFIFDAVNLLNIQTIKYSFVIFVKSRMGVLKLRLGMGC